MFELKVIYSDRKYVSNSDSFIVWFFIIKLLIANTFYTDTAATHQMYFSSVKRPMPGYLNTILYNLVRVVCSSKVWCFWARNWLPLHYPKISSYKECLHGNRLSSIFCIPIWKSIWVICCFFIILDLAYLWLSCEYWWYFLFVMMILEIRFYIQNCIHRNLNKLESYFMSFLVLVARINCNKTHQIKTEIVWKTYVLTR